MPLVKKWAIVRVLAGADSKLQAIQILTRTTGQPESSGVLQGFISECKIRDTPVAIAEQDEMASSRSPIV